MPAQPLISVSSRISQDTYDALRRDAKRTGRSLSSLIGELLDQYAHEVKDDERNAAYPFECSSLTVKK